MDDSRLHPQRKRSAFFRRRLQLREAVALRLGRHLHEVGDREGGSHRARVGRARFSGRARTTKMTRFALLATLAAAAVAGGAGATAQSTPTIVLLTPGDGATVASSSKARL